MSRPFLLKLIECFLYGGWWVYKATESHSALVLKHPSVYCLPFNSSAMVRLHGSTFSLFILCHRSDPLWLGDIRLQCSLVLCSQARGTESTSRLPLNTQRRSTQMTEYCTYTWAPHSYTQKMSVQLNTLSSLPWFMCPYRLEMQARLFLRDFLHQGSNTQSVCKGASVFPSHPHPSLPILAPC